MKAQDRADRDIAAAHESAASSVGLRYVDDTVAGIRRRKAGKAFSYRYDDGRLVRESGTLTRIRKLAIPPAYTEVWICADEAGHIQATARDARRRKQYRYHTLWRSVRDQEKFARVIAFGRALPTLRQRLRRDLASEGLQRDKVIALIVSVMAETLIRVGNDYYSRENRSYGLTTLRNRHMQPHRGRLRFNFRGKSGQDSLIELDDQRLVRLVRRVQQLPGQRLFQYLDDDGQAHPVDSTMVNDYLRETLGAHFTAKDFRTFGGTLHAAAVLARVPVPESEQEKKSALVEAVKQVAEVLSNTPAVCRGSYIHPDVLAGWESGRLHEMIPTKVLGHRRELERRVIAFLRDQARRRPPVAKRSPRRRKA